MLSWTLSWSPATANPVLSCPPWRTRCSPTIGWECIGVVVDNASLALHAALSWSFPALQGVALDTCHLPMKHEAVASHHGSAGSRMLRRLVSKFNVSFPSEVCPDVDALEPFRGERNRQFTGDEVLYNDHLCRASLPREHIDAAVTSTKSAEVWSGLAERIWALAASRLCTPKR